VCARGRVVTACAPTSRSGDEDDDADVDASWTVHFSVVRSTVMPRRTRPAASAATSLSGQSVVILHDITNKTWYITLHRCVALHLTRRGKYRALACACARA
jgi:hypothetical protein